MNGYEKIIGLMQQQAQKPSSFSLTTMTSPTSCKIDKLFLDGDDLYIADHLKSGWYKNEGEAMVYVEPLKAGDMVLIFKINDAKYAVVERLVRI